MKVYLKDNGVIIVGKAWQVKAMLKQYNKQFDTIDEWIRQNGKQKSKIGHQIHKPAQAE